MFRLRALPHVLSVLAALVPIAAIQPAPALAAFPGSNGPLAFSVITDRETQAGRTDLRDLDGADRGGFAVTAADLRIGLPSPDGTKRVGYVANVGVVVADIRGTARTVVLPDESAPASFLPDGRIILLRGSRDPTIWVMNADGSDLHQVLVGTKLERTRGMVVSPTGARICYVTEGNVAYGGGSGPFSLPPTAAVPDQVWCLDLSTGVRTLVTEHVSNGGHVTILVTDFSPDGARLLMLVQDEPHPSGGDTIEPRLLKTIGVDGSGLLTIPTPSFIPQSPTYSPDGQSIAYISGWARHDATDNTPRASEIRVVNVDGSGDRVVAHYPAGSFFYPNGLMWASTPAFTVAITGSTLVGNLFELDLTLDNTKDFPFTKLTYDSGGGAKGIVLNSAPFAPEHRAKVSVLRGPAPTLLSVLGPMSKFEPQYLLGIDAPGNLQIRAKVSAESGTTGPVTQSDVVYLTAEDRALSEDEALATAAGQYAELQADVAGDIDREFVKSVNIVNTALRSALPKGQRLAATRSTKLEQSLAQEAGLPSSAMSWLPSDPVLAAKSYWAFRQATDQSVSNVVKKRLGSASRFVIGEPLDYWWKQATGDAETTIPTMTAFMDEAAYWELKGEAGVKSFSRGVYKAVTDPAERARLKTVMDETARSMDAKLGVIAEIAPGKARQIALQMRNDPVGAARQLGTVYGQIKAEVGLATAEVMLTPNKAGIVHGLKSTANRIEGVIGIAEAASDASRTLKTLRTVDRTVDSVKTAAGLGMPKADQRRWSKIVTRLEAVGKKYGYDLDLELSFRPRNVHSADVKDAAGKVMFIKKGKAGTDLDVMLGMDESGLGKYVIYDAKRPANYKRLNPTTRSQIDERIGEMRAAKQEWYDKSSDVYKARRASGVAVASKLDNGAGITRVRMAIDGVSKNGTISVRYRHLVVDGKTIVRKGKAKWIVSDYDGDALLRVGNKKLPGGAVRGAMEAELMRLQREAGIDMPTSFHGFTKNGFDLPASTYRHTFKFLLEGMHDTRAQKELLKYLVKYGSGDAEKLLATYKSGDYVIRVTRSGASVGQGF